MLFWIKAENLSSSTAHNVTTSRFAFCFWHSSLLRQRWLWWWWWWWGVREACNVTLTLYWYINKNFNSFSSILFSRAPNRRGFSQFFSSSLFIRFCERVFNIPSNCIFPVFFFFRFSCLLSVSSFLPLPRFGEIFFIVRVWQFRSYSSSSVLLIQFTWSAKTLLRVFSIRSNYTAADKFALIILPARIK